MLRINRENSARWLVSVAVILLGLGAWLAFDSRSQPMKSGGHVTSVETSNRMPNQQSSRASGDNRSDGTHPAKVPLARNNDLDSALEGISGQGDFRPLERLLEGMSDSERYNALWKSLRASQSRLGKRHDFEEKIRLIGRFGGNKQAIHTKMACTNLAVGFDPATEMGFIKGLDDRLWKAFLQALADDNPRKALSLGEMNIAESRRMDAYSVATSAWLQQDSVTASSHVAALPMGAARDVAVGAMIDWLVNINDTASASQWVNEIGNEELKQKLSKRVVEATNR